MNAATNSHPSSPTSAEDITLRNVTIIAGVVVALTFIFGNVWTLAGELGKAAFDSVGPLLLIGWAEKAAELHRMHHWARSVLRSTCLVNAAVVRSMGLLLRR